MIKVKRLGHVTMSTPDLRAGVDYYHHALGLPITEQTGTRVVFSSPQGLEAIELVPGEAGQMRRISFQIAPQSDLKDVAKQLTGMGLHPEIRHDISPGVRTAVSFKDPRGTDVDLFAEYAFGQRALSVAPFNLLKLGHVAYRVRDVQEAVKFYTDVLGFRVSDWRSNFFVFLRCNTDHHTINFIIDDVPQLHHLAFEVMDWSDIHKAADHLANNNIHLVWGPSRHIIGHNIATYHRNKDLVRVEIFTQMDQMKDEDLGYFDPRPWHQEFPLYPKQHGPETLRSYWGYGSEPVIRGYQTTEIPDYAAERLAARSSGKK